MMSICFVLYFHLCLLDDESMTKRHIFIFFRFDNSKMTKRQQKPISVNCPIFGNEKDLWHRELPTYESVVKYCLYVRHSLKKEMNKDPEVSKITKYVTEKSQNNLEKCFYPSCVRSES